MSVIPAIVDSQWTCSDTIIGKKEHLISFINVLHGLSVYFSGCLIYFTGFPVKNHCCAYAMGGSSVNMCNHGINRMYLSAMI